MVLPSNGARLVVSWLARRSLSSKLLQKASSHLKKDSVICGRCRQFGSAILNQNQSFTSPNTINVYRRNWLKLGLIKTNSVPARSFHGSAAVAAKDYYETLGISKDAMASEIKQAYYELAKKLHPDKNKDDQEAEEKFQEVQKAYEVLKDDQKRQVYDQVGHDAFARVGTDGTDADLFHNDLNLGGKDVEVSLELSFMEAIQGCSKTVTFQTELTCQACGGTGAPPGTRPETCKQCKGSGVNLCRSCNGQRVVGGQKSVNINVMPGIDASDTIKLPRSGGADPAGKRPGNLDVFIKIRDDPIFRRKGSDIHVDAVLSISQAMLGGVIYIPTLTGDVAVKVRSGTQPGQKFVLKGKGIRTRNSYSFGDQYVHFLVSNPENLTKKQGELNLIDEFDEQERGVSDEPVAASASS